MTVLFGRVEDIAGATEHTPLVFWVPQLRENDAGTAMVTTQHHTLYASGGEFVTPDMDAGPAVVQIGVRQYQITIPESPDPIRLWPLIDAGMPAPPPSEQYQFVRNGGGLVRAQAVDLDEYESMTWDPGTLYIIKDAQVTE